MIGAPPQVRVRPGMLRALLDRRRSIAMFEGLAARGRELGTDIIRFHPMGRTVWLVTTPQLARELLVDHGRSVAKGEGLRVVRWVLGDGLLTTNDVAQHRRNRRLINPAFSAERMKQYVDIMVEAATQTASRWSNDEVVDIGAEMARLTLEVVGRTLMGDDTDSDSQAVAHALETVLSHFGLAFVPASDRIIGSRLPAAVSVRRAIDTMRDTVSRIITRHQGADGGGDDMVAALLTARDEGVGLTDEQLRDETLTLLLAGHETTANALTWAWWLLDRDPRSASMLRRELDAVLGHELPTYDDLKRLPVTTAIIAETMRLRPPAWMLEREVMSPIDLDGFTAPAGTTVLASPYMLHRDPRSWGEDAAVFRPERWLAADGSFDPQAPGQPRGAYVPFGAGSRICIGESFAWAEAVLLLAVLARQWSPHAEPGRQIGTFAAVTLRPDPSIRMRLAARDRSAS